MIKKIICIFFSIILAVFSIVILTSCSCKSSENKTCYDIECSLTNNALIGTENIVFFNSYDNTFKQLKFNLFGNAFREDAEYKPISSQNYSKAYYNGNSFGKMTIESVKSNGKNLNYEISGQDKNILIVLLENEIFPDESVQIEIQFTLKLANVNGRTGIGEHTINLGNFYPILCGVDNNGFYECVYYSNGDPFFSECANYNVSITCEQNLVVAGSGKKVSENKNGEKKTVKFSGKNIRSFALVLSKEFFVSSQNLDGIELNYYYFKDNNPEKTLKIARESLEYFSNTFGEYPYDTYSVVQTDFIEGGMEYPTLVYISSNLNENEVLEVVVHETAHQWWQSVVGNNEVEYGFLDEGLAEYSTVLFYENHAEYGMTRQKMIASSESTYRQICSVYDKIFGNVNTIMLRNLADFNSEYEYVNIAYIKPCIMYETLRKTIGEEKFFKALKQYYNKYKLKMQPRLTWLGSLKA